MRARLRDRIFRREDIAAGALRRWTLFRLPGGRALCVHNFRCSDARSMHDHPKRFVTIGLRGGYVEESLDPSPLLWASASGRPRRRCVAPWIRTFPARHVHGVIYSWLLHGKPGPAGFRFSREVRWRASVRADRWQPQFRWPLPNAWLGVSAEDEPAARERAAILRRTPAAVRWLSLEPLLGPMEIDDLLAGIDWVVVGGESGPGARPMDPAWVRSLHNQCICAQIPFFFKQWGGTTSKAGGCELDGRTWQQMPGASR